LVRISTGVAVADDPRGVWARDAVRSLSAGLEAYWRRLGDGQSAEAALRFEAARKRAQSFGVGLSHQMRNWRRDPKPRPSEIYH
jgi:hypothetical protein